MYYNSQLLVLLRYLSGWVYGFHMPLFFMLSGAVLALKPIGAFDQVVRSKIKRLLVPYFVYSWCFMLPIKYWGNFYDTESLKIAMKEVLEEAKADSFGYWPPCFGTCPFYVYIFMIPWNILWWCILYTLCGTVGAFLISILLKECVQLFKKPAAFVLNDKRTNST